MVGLYLPSLQAPSSHLPLPGMGGKYLYIQVENAMAVQVVQPLHQLLDVDLDLWWQRPGAQVRQPASTSPSASLPALFPPMLPLPPDLGWSMGRLCTNPPTMCPDTRDSSGPKGGESMGMWSGLSKAVIMMSHSGADEGWPTGQVWTGREKW